MAPGPGPDRAFVDPAALGGDQDGLGAIHRAELAVDVVQMGANGARREPELGGDLLVDHAAGQPAQDVDLASRHRAGVDLARTVRGGGQRQLVHDRPQVGGADADLASDRQQLRRGDRAAQHVVREHVRQAHEGGLAIGLLGMVALDHAGQRPRHPPATGQDAADQRMVDAELAALALDAVLRRPGLAVDLPRVAGVGVDQHQLADVVQQRRDHQPVSRLVADLAGQPVGGALGGDGMQAEALGNPLPDRRALEEVKCPRAAGDRVHGPGREHLDAGDRTLDAAMPWDRRPGWPAARR